MLWGALINNLPDIDVLTSFWMTQASGLLAHRGFTHSILFMVIMTPLLAYGLHGRYKTTSSYQDWLWLSGSNLFIHLFIDALTAYGTGWFEPFSHERVSLNMFCGRSALYPSVHCRRHRIDDPAPGFSQAHQLAPDRHPLKFSICSSPVGTNTGSTRR